MKKSLFICSFTALALALGACSDDNNNGKTGSTGCSGAMPDGKKDCVCVNGEWAECKDILEVCEGDDCDVDVKTNPVRRSMDSKVGCSLDSDCVEGAFCFEGQCVVQCSGDKTLKLNCDSGFYCDESRGRCVDSKYLQELKAVEDEIAAAGDAMTSEEKAARRAAVEVKAATMSNVRQSVLGQDGANGAVENVTFSERIPLAKIIDTKAKTQKVSFSTTDSIGDVQYVVRMSGVDLPVLKTSKGVQNKMGGYTYTFEIDTASIQTKRLKSLLRSGGVIETDSENVEIVSNAGSFPVMLTEPVDANGIYEGYVTPLKVLSGIDLPVRMGIEMKPEKVTSFADITEITLTLPVNDGEIFSPENMTEGKETWAKLKMSKKPKSDCNCGKPCWAADFSTNDFAPKGSILFGTEQHVNRNIRVELFDFDAPTVTFAGRLVDGLKGLYRVKAVQGDKILTSWNDNKMEASFSVQLASSIDEDVVAATHDHEPANEVIRGEESDPVGICTTEHIKALTAEINKIYKAYKEVNCEDTYKDEEQAEELQLCKNVQASNNINTLAEFEGLDADLQWTYISLAADAVNADTDSMSKVLAAVLEADAKGNDSADAVTSACGVEIHNLDDFQKACASASCSLCADHPEYVCAADLLARHYFGKDNIDTETQTKLMESWMNVVRESYLAQEYMSWNSDNEIRKSWLTGAVYANTFAASTMNTFNEDLLKDYRTKVLDVQRDSMRKQFSQTTLEMLAQSMGKDNKALKLRSARNQILSEMAQTWESVAKSLGLSARRYDVLSQDDAKRISTAKELRPYLFDLYFAGVLESAINLKADMGSLNAAFGADMSSIISKIESLDQKFEDLVFMRDGEIFTDTSLDTGNGLTALGKVKEAAKNSVEKAVAKRKTVFDEMSAKRKEKLSAQDSYLTSLEAMRAELVNLCGYPSDCQTDEQHQSCKIFTAPYFCGFSLESTSKNGVSISNDKDNSISQVTEFEKCKKARKEANSSIKEPELTIACAGGNLALDSYPVSTTGSTAVSEAGIAIQAFREAELEYQTALAEYDVLAQKVRNNYATLDAYAQNIEDWYAARKGVLGTISDNLESIKKYETALADYNTKLDKLKVDELQNEYDEQSKAMGKWNAMAASNMALQNAMQGIATGASIADIWVTKAANDADQKAQLSVLGGILTNTAVIGLAATAGTGTTSLLTATSASAAASALGVASAGLKTAVAVAESTAAIAQNTFDYEIEKLDRNKDLSLAGLQKDLASDIHNLKVSVEGIDGKYDADGIKKLISDMERANELLLSEMENEDTYKRDLQDFEFKRNEFGNIALDLISLAHTVKVKEVAKYRALLQYLTITQRAALVASQYDSKMSRYQLMQNALFSASEFFQTASDLESVESFIEFARNDLSNYLTAIEYLSVRPFVEIRRSIYTARGTNDFEKLYEQLNDLTDNCGPGTESTNKVILSLREQLGITNVAFNDLNAADRFHLILAKGNLPVSAQTRYTVTGSVADELKAGAFYSASFDIGSHFANIDTSCNAKIDSIKVRFISKDGKKIRETGNLTPSVSLFYGGQTQLLSCHKNIEAVTASIGPRTTYGKFSTFSATPFADGINAGVYEIPEGENYEFSDTTELSDVTDYKGLKGYPLMATYSLVFDPAKGNNSKINWDNVADIEIQINYTTGTLGQDSAKCKYDM